MSDIEDSDLDEEGVDAVRHKTKIVSRIHTSCQFYLLNRINDANFEKFKFCCKDNRVVIQIKRFSDSLY